ncbi:MAG: aminoacyl-tRNA hydrolase [Bacilli bacterium]|nr:aminoacyl-tRNA hydrolase [Bacilli bacterium]MBR6055934.1 aminoacyl-tRNA hydrolase [Bacilli bacterium]
MRLFVGLGNPGRQYEGTRHNMGYMAVDKFMELVHADFDRPGFKGVYGIVKNPDLAEPIIVLKPETFMNLSGESVVECASFYKIDVEDIVVVYDDMAIAEGQIRLRLDGSSGGHKGIQNIIDKLGTEKIKRIRIGIGEPQFDSIDFVLGKPSAESMPLIEEATDNAAKALLDIERRGFQFAMTRYNSIKKKEEK